MKVTVKFCVHDEPEPMDLRFDLGEHDPAEASALARFLSTRMSFGWSAGSVLRTLVAYEAGLDAARASVVEPSP